MVIDHLLRRRFHNTALRLGHRCRNSSLALKACVALFLIGEISAVYIQ